MKLLFKTLSIMSLAVLFVFSSCKNETKDKTVTPDTEAVDSTAVKIAEEAFVFGLPLALVDITRRKLTNFEVPNQDGAPINQFANKNSFPNYTFTDVVRPNADTYYSTANIDLSMDALVLTVPASNGRYYMIPMMDAYSNIFKSLGSRTTGDKAGKYLITGPKWSGAVPDGLTQIKAPTNNVWIIGRIKCNGKEDGEKVVIPFQKQLKLTPLSSYGKPYTEPKGTIDTTVPKAGPNAVVEAMSIQDFFNYINELMVKNPPFTADKPAMDEFTKIDVAPGANFDISKYNAATQEAMNKIPKAVYARIAEMLAKPGKLVNGWNIIRGIGDYGTDYEKRAVVGDVGLGANLTKDAIYPSNSLDQDGKPYNGANKYVIHFDKGQTPPVNGFWSLTMYNADGYFIENPINVYAVGHGAPFTYNADGSLDIYIQNESPGKDKQNNWLPAPKGDFNVMMRLYWPKETDPSILNETWNPPAIKKAS